MVKIQMDIDEFVDKNLKLYMIYNDVKTKTEAIENILNEYFLLRPPKMRSE